MIRRKLSTNKAVVVVVVVVTAGAMFVCSFQASFAVYRKEEFLYGLIKERNTLYLQIYNRHKIIFLSKSQSQV